MNDSTTDVEKRMFALRWAGIAGSLIGTYDRDDVETSEICPTCLKQGTISLLHDESEPHRGTPHFKPFKVTPEYLRKMADELEGNYILDSLGIEKG